LRIADEAGLELTRFYAALLVAEGKIEPAVALAAFVLGHPITWKETGDLARAMLAKLAEKIDVETFQAESSRLRGRDIRELTAGWLADYEANVEALAE
jgi:hypothetical protein